MPGTVQVSILDLQGLPASTPSSSISIKVSLGKNAYETQGEKGDFLLPLATLRDNLVVKVHDAEGNEIASTGVKSRSIAEKGLWDDLFPLEGGGYVHMRLKFSLSEEERNKIRDMRESALKKKRYELLTGGSKDLETRVASSGGKRDFPGTAAISNNVRSSDLPQKASSEVMSSKLSSKPVKSSALTQAKEDTQHHNPMDQTQSEKKPSRVRKRVAAFESSPPLQEQIPDVNLTTAKPQSSRKIADAHSKKQTSEDISAENGPVGIRSTSYESEFIKEGKDQLHDFEESRKRVSSKESSCSSSLEQYTMSERVLLHSDKSQPSNPVTRQQFVSVDSKHSQERMRPEVSGREHDSSCQKFRGWIFLEETTCSCVADNRGFVDLLADAKVNKKNYTGKLVNDKMTTSNNKKHSGMTKKTKSCPSPSSGDSRGPNGQVLKMVMMVGFGLLVLFTRKTNSR